MNNPMERQTHREVEETRETGAHRPPPAAPTSPCTPPKAPLFPEAFDMGPATASLFRIAESQTHPDPPAALETLRQRIRESVDNEEKLQSRVPNRTALRDIATTSDSLWVPTLKAALVVLLCALAAAVIYGVVHWLEPAAMEPAAVGGTAIATLLGL